ncbi:hypothetical protein DFJ73DRAFT_766235 [Zopfochytrium polystomum]|nr:hypothetical protein DFJ73DRAFT_766235 [Zopfochytrium polystomum]
MANATSAKVVQTTNWNQQKVLGGRMRSSTEDGGGAAQVPNQYNFAICDKKGLNGIELCSSSVVMAQPNLCADPEPSRGAAVIAISPLMEKVLRPASAREWGALGESRTHDLRMTVRRSTCATRFRPFTAAIGADFDASSAISRSLVVGGERFKLDQCATLEIAPGRKIIENPSIAFHEKLVVDILRGTQNQRAFVRQAFFLVLQERGGRVLNFESVEKIWAMGHKGGKLSNLRERVSGPGINEALRVWIDTCPTRILATIQGCQRVPRCSTASRKVEHTVFNSVQELPLMASAFNEYKGSKNFGSRRQKFCTLPPAYTPFCFYASSEMTSSFFDAPVGADVASESEHRRPKVAASPMVPNSPQRGAQLRSPMKNWGGITHRNPPAQSPSSMVFLKKRYRSRDAVDAYYDYGFSSTFDTKPSMRP